MFLSLLFRLKVPSPFNVSSQDKCSSSLTIFVYFHWTLFRVFVSLALKSLELDSRHKILPHHHWGKGKDPFPQPAGNTLFNIAEGSTSLVFLFLFKFCQELLAHLLGGLLLSLEDRWISTSFLGSLAMTGLYPTGFFQTDPWRGNNLLSWSPGLWSCFLSGSLLSGSWTLPSHCHWSQWCLQPLALQLVRPC